MYSNYTHLSIKWMYRYERQERVGYWETDQAHIAVILALMILNHARTPSSPNSLFRINFKSPNG